MTDSLSQLFQALDLTAEGLIDQSGKTPLDDALECIHPISNDAKHGLSQSLIDHFPTWAKTSPRHLKFARQIVKRLNIRAQPLARVLQTLLGTPPVSTDADRRLWVSLILMDMGFPRSVAALEADVELKRAHIGEWLSLVSANNDYIAIRRAFIEAAQENLIAIPQLCLKAEVIRQKFGEKLRDFFESVMTAYSSDQDRKSIADAASKMYGLNLNWQTPVNQKWWGQKTELVIARARDLVPA
jgi:hypothetical protein